MTLYTEKEKHITSTLIRTCPHLKGYVLPLQQSYHSTAFLLSFAFINFLISVVASCSNFIVIYTILKTPSLRTLPNILILGLAISDFGVGVKTQPSGYMLAIFEWKENLYLYCADALVANASVWSFSAMSFFTLTFITLDRFLAVHLHLRYQELVTAKRYVMVLVFISFIGILAVVFRLVIGSKTIFVMAFLVLSTLIPLNGFLITNISRVVHRHSVQIQAQRQSAQQSLNMPRYKKSVNTMYYVIAAFVLCYIPYRIGLTVLAVVKKWTLEINYLFTITITLLMFNGVLNPIIYCWRIEDIRSNAKRLLRRMWKRNEIQGT